MTPASDPPVLSDEEGFELLECETDLDAELVDPPARLDDDCLGVDLIDRAVLRHAIRGPTQQGGRDGETSLEEANRLKLLRRLFGDSLYKRHLFGAPALLERLAALRTDMPQFRDAVDVVRRAARLSLATDTPLRLPPLLLLGPPGIGKTHFAQALARALQTTVTMVAGATLADRGVLTGANASWRGARPGALAKTLLDSDTLSPVMLIDEVDKMTGLSAHEDPLDAVLSMLEPETAQAYKDEYLDVPMRADQVIWIMTANALVTLSEPLRDRLLVLDIPDLTAVERTWVQGRIFALLNATLGEAFDLAPDALAPVARLNTRRAKAVLLQALGMAADQGRRTVTATDVAQAVELVVNSGSRRSQRIGFGLMDTSSRRD